MKLSDRKKKILQYVVDDYILTAQPVSSKNITEKYMNDISSATVRSELAGLEEMGLLSQPHTSSGRVPSAEAYKLYVSELMDKGKLSAKDLVSIRHAFEDKAINLETVVQNAVKVISELTDLTSVGCTSPDEKDEIVKIDIFRYKPNQALLLIVTKNTFIRDKFIEIPEIMSDDQILEASEMMSKLFIGKTFSEIIEFGSVVEQEFSLYREIFDRVISAIESYVKERGNNVVVGGEDKILNNPEYNDTEKVKNFLSIITSKDKLADLLQDGSDDIEINIKIGGEEDDGVPKDCSLVTATYSSSGVKVGTYGVIGPLRMDYQKVVSVLEGVGKILNDMLNNK